MRQNQQFVLSHAHDTVAHAIWARQRNLPGSNSIQRELTRCLCTGATNTVSDDVRGLLLRVSPDQTWLHVNLHILQAPHTIRRRSTTGQCPMSARTVRRKLLILFIDMRVLVPAYQLFVSPRGLPADAIFQRRAGRRSSKHSLH